MSTAEILVVDDDPTSLLLLARTVEMAGYKPTTAKNGQEALEKISVLHPVMVLIDVMMPKIDGFEVCRQIRGNATLTRQPYIMMLTGRNHPADYRQAKESGVNEVINKPFNPITVAQRVRTVLEK